MKKPHDVVPPSSPALQAQFITIHEEDAGQRIDNYSAACLQRRFRKATFTASCVPAKCGSTRAGSTSCIDCNRATWCASPRSVLQKKNRLRTSPAAEFAIIHEDSHLLVIDKPCGVAVHGGSGVSYGVIEQLRASRPDAKFLELVHRLDRETSGLLLLAKKRSALTNLHEQMRDGLTDKRYLTMVAGDWKNARQHIKLPLHKYTTAEGERRVVVQAGGMESHTVFSLLRKWPGLALLEAELKTGRTHQIRVHLSSSGFPILGDDKYGDFALNRQLLKAEENRGALRRMFLHAHQITFLHPESGKPMTLNAMLPPECERFLVSLGKPQG